METIELVGYLVFTMAAAGLMIGFLYSIDFAGVQNTLSNVITPKEDFSNIEKVNYIQLIQRMQRCNVAGADSDTNTNCGNVLLTDELIEEPYLSSGLDKNFFEWTFNQINYCTDCNLDLLGTIMPNTIVKLTFNENNSGQIKIAGTFNVPSDTLSPVTSLSGCLGGTSSTQETITLSCTDPSPSYMGCKETKYKLDGGSFQTYSSSFNLAKLASDHTYSVEYFSEDNNNNTETTKTFSCTILASVVPATDTTTPVTSFTGNSSGWNTSDQTITLQCTDNVACKTNNPIQYRYYPIGTVPPAWSSGTQSTSFTITQPVSADTNYQIDYYSTDTASPANVENTNTKYVAIRASAPADTYASCTLGTSGVTKSVIGGKDNNVFCTADGTMWSTTIGGYTWADANVKCSDLTYAGFSDWYFPDYPLFSVNNATLTASTSWDVNYNHWPYSFSYDYYWTSTPYAGGVSSLARTNSAQYIQKSEKINTRCVRNSLSTSPTITVRSVTNASNPSDVSLSCSSCGSDKVEFRMDNSPWMTYNSTFKVQSSTATTLNVYTRTIDASGVVAVAEKSDPVIVSAYSPLNSPHDILKKTGSPPSMSAGNVNIGVAGIFGSAGISNMVFTSYLDSASTSNMAANSCEFTLDGGTTWILGITTTANGNPACQTPSISMIQKGNQYEFIVQARVKDLGGMYSYSGRAKMNVFTSTGTEFHMCNADAAGTC
jgi:hypothetical protein